MALCRNVGGIDRVVRTLIGIVALVLAASVLHVMEGSLPGMIAAGVGVIMLLTAVFGMCPLYVPLKLSTCSTAAR